MQQTKVFWRAADTEDNKPYGILGMRLAKGVSYFSLLLIVQVSPAHLRLLVGWKDNMVIDQSNRLRSYKAVAVVLETHEPIWSVLPAFGKGVTEFTGIIEDINTQAQIQLESEQASEEKLTVLKTLGVAAYEVSGAVQAYAVEVNDLALEARVDFSRSAVTLGKEDQVLSRCWAIHALATEQLANLADNGITAAKLNAFKKKIEAFEAVQSKPRNRVNKGRAATQQLEVLFRDANTVLNKRLDKLATQFAESAPEFVNEYLSARVVVDVRGTAKAKKTMPAPAPTPA